jgi:DNA modification methylase
MDEMNIVSIEISRLNPAPYNPRLDLKPGDADYEKLLRSVEEFGYVEPIVWNERSGNVVGGHQRLKVLKHLGYSEAQCVVLDLCEEREKALNVALNNIGGEFDQIKLVGLLRDLKSTGFDTTLTGFEDAETDKMFQSFDRESGKIKEDNFDADAEAAAIETPITQLGDIWLIGRHRLMCGDSTDIGAAAKLMAGKRAKMVFTDPPWNVDYGGDAKHPSWKARSIMNDKMSSEDFYKFLLAAGKSLASVCEPGAMAYMVMSAKEWGSIMTAMEKSGFHWSSTIIWSKDSFVLSRKDYNTQYEPIWYGWLEGAKGLCHLEDRKQSDVWQIDRPKKSPDHPTMKPVALAGRAIENSSRIGDIVLDLFGGSGTTLMAADQCDRSACLMELDPKYCDCIVKRYIKIHESDEGVFLLRDGEKMMYHEVPQP